jgi:hypothetical protein
MSASKRLVLLASLSLLLTACAQTASYPEGPIHTPSTVTTVRSSEVTAVVSTPLPQTATPLPLTTVTFTSVPTAALQPERLDTGRVRLYSSLADTERSRLDLDTGRVMGQEDPRADVEFLVTMGSGVFYSLETVNGSRAKALYAGMNGYDDCLQHRDELVHTSLTDYSVGVICVLTNEGRLSLLRYTTSSLTPYEEWVELAYTTWRATVP